MAQEDEQGAAAEMIDNVEASSFLEHGHALTMTVFAHNTTTCHVCASPLTEGDKGYRCAGNVYVAANAHSLVGHAEEGKLFGDDSWVLSVTAN
jgi:hypothetical protein